MMEAICNPEQCTGCMACLNACPVDAISIDISEKGFYIPKISGDICIDCGNCRDVCTALNILLPNPPQQVYALWSKNENLRYDSTSGGAFSLLAEKILAHDGYVFGVGLNKEWKAEHIQIDNLADLNKLRGSKYIQSCVGDIYRKVKIALSTGKPVLFSGTPCQVAALRNYLGEEYDNLLLVDILCHGVPSPEVFERYLEYIREKTSERGDISDVSFRNKFHSWNLFRMQIKFVSGTVYSEPSPSDPFLRAFLRDYCLNDACYDCRYVGASRQGDITLADFWGYLSEHRTQCNDDKGISLVMVNTQKGLHWFHEIDANQVVVIEKTLNEAMVGNHTLRHSTHRPEKAAEFWACFLEKRNFEDCMKLLLPEKQSGKHMLRLWIDAHYFLLPGCLKKVYRKLVVNRGSKI